MDLLPAGKRLLQIDFVRFVLVGGLNTVVGYGMFAIAILIGLEASLALLIATVLGVLFNYFSIRRGVFSSRNSGRLWRFILVYGIIYALNATALSVFQRLGIGPLLAQAFVLPACVLISYVLNKTFVFRQARTIDP